MTDGFSSTAEPVKLPMGTSGSMLNAAQFEELEKNAKSKQQGEKRVVNKDQPSPVDKARGEEVKKKEEDNKKQLELDKMSYPDHTDEWEGKPWLSLTTYEKGLAFEKIPRDRAAKIIDSILIENKYAETCALPRGGFIRFRVRDVKDSERITDNMEENEMKYSGTIDQMVLNYNLANSIVEYKMGSAHMTFSAEPKSADEFEKALLWVRGLNLHLYNYVSSSLIKFDNRIRVSLSEGALENF